MSSTAAISCQLPVAYAVDHDAFLTRSANFCIMQPHCNGLSQAFQSSLIICLVGYITHALAAYMGDVGHRLKE